MSITFEGFDLNDSTFITSSIEYRNLPARDIVLQSIARRPGKKLTSHEFAERRIKLAGWILGTDSTDLTASIDDFNNNVTRQQAGTLSVETGREIEAIVSSVSLPEQYYNQSIVPFEIEFIAAEPFWKGPQQTVSLVVASGVGEPQTNVVTLTISGSVFAEPSITYTAPGTTGNTTTSGIIIEYLPTSEKITWSGSSGSPALPYGNFVKFDYQNQLILQQSTEIEATGVYSRWNPGETTFTATFSGQAQGGQLDFVYRPRYL